MNNALLALQKKIPTTNNLLQYFLVLPKYNFDITLEYMLFYKDFLDLKRSYSDFFKKVEGANTERKKQWLQLLLKLQESGFLHKNLSIDDLEYIMDLSAGIRLLYFQEKECNELNKKAFTVKVNKLLHPYLSNTGKKVFSEFDM